MKIGTAEIALAVALAVALWNLVRYLLEGGRVRVRMRPTVLTYPGHLSQGPQSGWKREGRTIPRERGSVELAAMTVENLGRTAVTVSDFSLDFGRPRRLGRHRYRVSGRPVEYEGCTTEGRVRLEPFDQCAVLSEVWPLVDMMRREQRKSKRQRRKLRVRASVQVAGKRFRRRSPWARGWRIDPEQSSLIPDHTPDVSELVYRAVWRSLRFSEDAAVHTLSATYRLEKLFEDGKQPGLEAIMAVLNEVFDHDSEMIGYSMQIAMEVLRTMKESGGKASQAESAAY